MLTAIKFPCTWRDGTGTEHFAVHAFTLGLGPCGKDCILLEYHWYGRNLDNLAIEQICSDGSRKTFTYRREDLCGRIEVEYDTKH